MAKIELSEEIKELICEVLDDDLERKLVFLIESRKNYDEILEELIKEIIKQQNGMGGDHK